MDATLPGRIFDIIEAADFPARRLTLEVTESDPIKDIRRARLNVRALRRIGIQIALDDFGTGFSTATRLELLECDELKIDRKLVEGMEHHEEQRLVIRELIDFAHARAVTVCVEGIETRAALKMVDEFSCDRVQGYLIGRPGPPPSIPELVRRWSSPT
jgi:EAL domain-containing protein (putative c-di-GMP-specific phosphodiesterase class I)